MVEIPEGPALKIERAKQHINDLQGQINTYLATNPMKLVVRQDGRAAVKSLSIKQEQPIPLALSAVLGDAVHNLRASLDLFAYHLIGHLGASEQGVHFPFAWKPEKVRETIRSRQIHLAGEHVADAVAELDFYLGGNPLLSGLHLLDIADKHRLIIPVGRVASLTANAIKKNLPEAPISGPGVIHYEGKDNDVFRIVFSGTRADPRNLPLRSFERDADVQPGFLLCFGPDTPFSGMGIVPKLIEISAEVERAIKHVLSATLR